MRWTIIKTKKLPQSRLGQLLKFHDIDLVLDVGANVGQYATSLRQLKYKGDILSFEPTSRARKNLLEVSKKDKNWSIYPQAAVGDTTGEAEINVSEATDMSSILDLEESTVKTMVQAKVAQVEKVKVYKLDDIFTDVTKNYKNIFLKVDTQGFEWHVLQGAQKSLSHIAGIQLELSMEPMYKGEKTFDEISVWLRQQGFVPHLFIPGYFSQKLQRQVQTDIVFINTKRV